jgi:quercetin dioxygenase-like cupin family protein
MDVIGLAQARRFLRERPLRISVLDRPRLVCELLCLEEEQTEVRPSFPASDQLYLVIEGRARIRAGPQIQDLGELDALLVPPGVEHHVANAGPGRLTALAIVTPKPARSGEVPMPSAAPSGRRARTARLPQAPRTARREGVATGRGQTPRTGAPRQGGRSRRAGAPAADARADREAPPVQRRGPRRERQEERPPPDRRTASSAGGRRGQARPAARGTAPADSRVGGVPGRRPRTGGRRDERAGAPPRRGPETGREQRRETERPRRSGQPQRDSRGGQEPGRRPRQSPGGRRGRPGSGRSGPRT